MGKGMVILGRTDTGSPTPATAEDAAQEYFVNRRLAGDWAPRPPIERWHRDQRELFEAELERLERQGP
jgi:hypothetical protein